MTRNTTLIAGFFLLLAGAGAFILANNNDEPATRDKPTASAVAKPRGERGGFGPGEGAGEPAMTKRVRPAVANSDLVAEYGEARTKYSRQIAGNVVTLLDDVVAMGEKMGGGGGFGGQRGALMALGGVGRQLELSDEQRTKTEALLADFQKRELEKSKAAINSLRNDPQSLMRMMLASDKFSRGEITEDQYKAIQLSSQTELQGLMNPLDRQNFQGGRPLGDATFRQGMLEVLDPKQTETFNAAIEARPATPAAGAGGIAELPPMDLEKLDKTITSAQTLTRGVQQMMEGLGNLQELGTAPK
jgi:hypothetical protein